MSEPSPDPTPSGPKQASWDAISEKELDDALSQAASLASELSGQLASPDEPSPRVVQDPLDADRDRLDRELSQLGDLVAAASNEVADQGADTDPQAPTSNESVPDFMSEFMSPSAVSLAPASTTVPNDLAVPTDPAPPRNRPLPGVVGNPINIVIPSVARRVKVEAPATSENRVVSQDGNGCNVEGSLGAFGPIVAMLNALDRPFAWAGSSIRKPVGWIALLLLAASVVVYLIGPL